MKYFETKNPCFKIRFAQEEDISAILYFIKQLAAYENMLDKVFATEENLKKYIFDNKMVEVIIGEYDGLAVAFALFYNNFSTFEGSPGIYLEDLFVKLEMRGKGLGKAILTFLAQLTVKRDFRRLEWSCLDWNEPSIKFYKSLGAVPMNDWTLYRLGGDTLKNLAEIS